MEKTESNIIEFFPLARLRWELEILSTISSVMSEYVEQNYIDKNYEIISERISSLPDSDLQELYLHLDSLVKLMDDNFLSGSVCIGCSYYTSKLTCNYWKEDRMPWASCRKFKPYSKEYEDKINEE